MGRQWICSNIVSLSKLQEGEYRMKRKLLAASIAGLMMAPAALADVTVYGKANLSYQQLEETYTGAGLDFTSQDNWEMLSNASRIGIKGSHDISDTLKGIYKIEYQYDATGSNSNFDSRNIYVGLQHATYGTLIGGKHDTPTKLSQGNVDQFNDLEYADIKNYMVGENREDNIVMYSTPNFNGLSATIAFMPGEDSGCVNPTNPAACSGNGQDDNNFADEYSVSVNYTQKDAFSVAIAMDDNVENTDILRVAGQVYLGSVTLGALAQEATVHDDYSVLGVPTAGIGKMGGIAKNISTDNGLYDIASATGVGVWNKQSAMVVSAAWTIDDYTLKAQYGSSKTSTDSSVDPLNLAEFEIESTSVGVDYQIDKYSKVFAYYSLLDANPDAAFTKGTIKDDQWQTFGVGIEMNF
jgi:predicted porin